MCLGTLSGDESVRGTRGSGGGRRRENGYGRRRVDDRGGLLLSGLLLRIWKEGIFHQYIQGDRYSELFEESK